MNNSLLVTIVIAFVGSLFISSQKTSNNFIHYRVNFIDPPKGQRVHKKFIENNLLQKEQIPGGAPISPDMVFVTNNITWINNLQGFIGMVVKVEAKNGEPIVTDMLTDVKFDSVKVKVDEADFKNSFSQTYKKDNVKEIGFMGISLAMTDKEEYSYQDNILYQAVMQSNKIDPKKVKEEYKCLGKPNCDYYYINGASVRLCEVRHYVEKGNDTKIRVNELGGLLAKIGPTGKIATSKISEDVTKKYSAFFTVLRLP